MRAAATAVASSPDADSNAAGSFKTPLLARLLARSDPEQPEPRTVVLDLGGTSQPLLERLADRGPCRVEIADLASSGGLKLLNEAESPEQAYSLVLEWLLPKSGHYADLILCWDLPNYLSLEALTGLFAALGARAAPRGKLHMLIAYAEREMSADPGRFHPDGGEHLINIEPAGLRKTAPRYSPEDLGHAVGQFQYERGVLLANGMQEFVYAWP